MELRRPKWSPKGLHEAQQTQKYRRRPKWSPGDLNGAQEAQMEPRRSKWTARMANLLAKVPHALTLKGRWVMPRISESMY